VAVSAKTGEGLDNLVRAVKTAAGAGSEMQGSAQWMMNVRHQGALQRAHEALVQAVQAAQTDRYEECVAMELQNALQALGEIIGESTTEDLLDHVFSKFCIGK
jgi:tRNA modification GTPase